MQLLTRCQLANGEIACSKELPRLSRREEKKSWLYASSNHSGKTIIPFCTSGGSGVGRSDSALHKNVSGNVKWAKGVQINRPDEISIRRMLEKAL